MYFWRMDIRFISVCWTRQSDQYAVDGNQATIWAFASDADSGTESCLTDHVNRGWPSRTDDDHVNRPTMISAMILASTGGRVSDTIPMIRIYKNNNNPLPQTKSPGIGTLGDISSCRRPFQSRANVALLVSARQADKSSVLPLFISTTRLGGRAIY